MLKYFGFEKPQAVCNESVDGNRINLSGKFRADAWDAPRSLKDMFEEIDESIVKFVEDYKVHLIVPNEIRDFDEFATDFGKVMKCIAVSKDKVALEQLQNDEEF